MKAIGARTLKEIGDMYREYDVIGIDEGQFFPDVLLLNSLILLLGRGMDRSSGQWRQGRDHLGFGRDVPSDRFRVHLAANPEGREGQEVASHLQGLQPERELYLQDVQLAGPAGHRGRGLVQASVQGVLQR